ncbi:MAG: 1,4-alpha-glucan branching protein GlgB [Candidatus Nanopelagicales bacterium]|nr:1,4-alpha-glucan branching protein GlgB [Candidatus Nanopelagicales bacterium]
MAKATPVPVDTSELDRLVDGAHHDPHSLLGPHKYQDAITVRVLRPLAESVRVIVGDKHYDLKHEHRGVWVGVLPIPEVPDYSLDVTFDGRSAASDDPYRFLPTLGEIDIYLIGEGRHEELWTVVGAHRHVYESLHGPVTGTSFAVWAPSAMGVRILGDFNFWDGSGNPMRSLGSSGVWELFLPGVGEGAKYKFAILGADFVWREKADPLAFATECPPQNASVVFTSNYEWRDADWMRRRAKADQHNGPLSIYEVHLGSWRQGLSYAALAEELTDYVTQQGFTHVEFLPVTEYPYEPSWGYQVTSYFAPSSRFGNPDEFRYLVDRLHQAGIGVIMDWVPAHFPKDDWALSRFDGTPLYEHPDPRRGEQPDWGTYVFNFGRREVRNFLVASAVFWLETFHIDGLRVDAVASMLYLDYSRKAGEWLPNEYGGRENLEAVAFIQEMNATVYRRCPGIVTIAEESTAWPGVTRPTHLGGLGFGLKWSMGWMHDTLDYVSREPIYRQYHHSEMTFSMMYAYTEQFVLPLSHDEVVHGKGSLINKMPGDRWQQLATLRAYLAFMWAHPGKQLLFMGGEFAQSSEWSEARSLDWWLLDYPEHRGVQACVRDLNSAYRATPAVWQRDHDPSGFEWVDANDSAGNVFSWLRFGADCPAMACVVNMSPVVRYDYRMGLPQAGRWEELINTDATAYGGSGVGNLGGVQTDETPWHNRPTSASMTLPPLAAVWLRQVD